MTRLIGKIEPTGVCNELREKRSEIGLLTALGAPSGLILRLFLGEAVILGALGGLLGVLIGLAGLGLLHLGIPALPFAPRMDYLLIAEALALLIGLAAGVLPAMSAARLDPIEALREE